MAFLWLAMLLTPVSCVPPTDRSPHQVPSADAESPIKNLRIDVRSKTLFWDITGNVSTVECFINSNAAMPAETDHSCKFYVLPKCTVSNFTVNVTMAHGPSFSKWILYPPQEGNPRAAAQRLKCRIHDVDFLTCTWEVGPEAPRDVQYHLYLEDMIKGKRWDCPHHTANELGTHIQCQFSNLTGFVKQFRFVVDGRSAHARVPCSEFITYLSDIEEISPPNVTVSCNQSHAILTWKRASRFFSRKLRYELEIQKGMDPAYIQQHVLETSFALSNPGAYTLRVRALVRDYKVSQWSAPQPVVCQREEDGSLRFWLTPLAIALATLLLVGSTLLLCRRYSLLQKLVPPIPRMKDPMGDNLPSEKMLAWESDRAGQECPVATVQVLGEP